MLCNGPESEVSEELCEGGGQVVGVEAAGVGEDPGVAAAERGLLEADAGVFDAGDDAEGADADEGDDGGAPAFDFGLETPDAGVNPPPWRAGQKRLPGRPKWRPMAAV